MTTHSPGPWETRCSYDPVTGKLRGLYLIDSKSKTFAHVTLMAETEEENEKNASLLLSAPEILAAAEMGREAIVSPSGRSCSWSPPLPRRRSDACVIFLIAYEEYQWHRFLSPPAREALPTAVSPYFSSARTLSTVQRNNRTCS